MALIDHIPDIPNEYLLEIGRVTFRWSVLESVLHICLVKVSGRDILEGRSIVIFTHMSFPQKIDVLGAIISELMLTNKYPHLSGYSAVEKLLKDAQKRRNDVIHATWGFENGAMMMGKVTARGSLKIISQPITVSELQETSDLISRAAESLYSLINNDDTLKSPPPQSGQ